MGLGWVLTCSGPTTGIGRAGMCVYRVTARLCVYIGTSGCIHSGADVAVVGKDLLCCAALCMKRVLNALCSTKVLLLELPCSASSLNQRQQQQLQQSVTLATGPALLWDFMYSMCCVLVCSALVVVPWHHRSSYAQTFV